MNSANSEISNAIREAQSDRTTVLRYVCLVCKEYLSEWDVEAGGRFAWNASTSTGPNTSRFNETTWICSVLFWHFGGGPCDETLLSSGESASTVWCHSH